MLGILQFEDPAFSLDLATGKDRTDILCPSLQRQAQIINGATYLFWVRDVTPARGKTCCFVDAPSLKRRSIYEWNEMLVYSKTGTHIFRRMLLRDLDYRRVFNVLLFCVRFKLQGPASFASTVGLGFPHTTYECWVQQKCHPVCDDYIISLLRQSDEESWAHSREKESD